MFCRLLADEWPPACAGCAQAPDRHGGGSFTASGLDRLPWKPQTERIILRKAFRLAQENASRGKRIFMDRRWAPSVGPRGVAYVLARSRVKESMPEKTAKPKVLVADDEQVIADTLAMILNQSGFEARAVYSGEKALELAETFAPDMLISDVIMADLNGIEAAIRIQALLPRIKILLFSGQAATADLLEKARARGYEFEILAKPVHPQDLLRKLSG
jgi:CheY-like chemotaxis protein